MLYRDHIEYMIHLLEGTPAIGDDYSLNDRAIKVLEEILEVYATQGPMMSDLDLEERICNVLRAHRMWNVPAANMRTVSRSQMMRARNFGVKSLMRLEQELLKHNIELLP